MKLESTKKNKGEIADLQYRLLLRGQIWELMKKYPYQGNLMQVKPTKLLHNCKFLRTRSGYYASPDQINTATDKGN